MQFDTANTHYHLQALGFGAILVRRLPRYLDPAFTAPEVWQEFTADAVSVHPAEPGGSVLEARKVVFWRQGRPVCVTSGGDSRTYLEFPWGSYVTLKGALAAIHEHNQAVYDGI